MLPELKQAIIRHIPDYFTWDQDCQEQYRVNMPDEDFFKVKQFLLKALLDITVVNEEQLDEAVDNLSDAQSTMLNAARLPLEGIGENYFWLNEYFPESKTILSFETLYDYDFEAHKFQQEAKEKDFKDHQKKSYRGSLYLTWARLMIKEQFYYATLTMAAGYIYSKLDECGQDYIEELIPHEYVKGKKHGAPDKGGFLWDYKPDAGGLELQLKELEHRFWDYLKNVWVRLEKEFDKESLQQVFIFDESKPSESQFIMFNDPCLHCVFTDKMVLKKIYFKTFMQDCWDAEQKDHSEFLKKIDDEKQDLKRFLDAQYQDIMANFDPNVLKFRKKYKIVCHKDSGLI